MKALSLKQPFAELILQKRKTIELRNWNTKLRGEFIIHASKVPDSKAMKRFGFKALPLGQIVGKANLAEVKRYSSPEQQMEDADKHLADSSWGKYGFILTDVKRMESIPARGNLNFWEVSETLLKEINKK